MSDFDPVRDLPTECSDCGDVHDNELMTYDRKLMACTATVLGELASNFDDLLGQISKLCEGDQHKITMVLAALACAHVGSGYPDEVFRRIYSGLRRSAEQTQMDETMQTLLRGPRGLA